MSDDVNKVRSEIRPKGFADEEDEKLVRRPTSIGKNEKNFEKIYDEGFGDKKEENVQFLQQPIAFLSGEYTPSTMKKEDKEGVIMPVVPLRQNEEVGSMPQNVNEISEEIVSLLGKKEEKNIPIIPLNQSHDESKSFLLAADKSSQSVTPIKQEFSTLIKDIGKQAKHETIEAMHLTIPHDMAPLVDTTATNPVHPNPIQRIINLIAEQITLVETKNQNDTTITIKNIPLFEGSTMTVSTFKTAKGEINITFDNLTQQAKNILDLAENRNALQVGLDQKGYTVHIITTTTIEKTYADAPIYKENRNEFADREQSAYDQQKQQQQNQDNKES